MPSLLATFELDDITILDKPTHSPLESKIISEPRLVTCTYELVYSKGHFIPKSRSVLQTVNLTFPSAAAEDVVRWYKQVWPRLYYPRQITPAIIHKEHIGMLSVIPGWLRSRVLKNTSSGSDSVQFMGVHEYDASNGLEGPEHTAARNTPGRSTIMDQLSQPTTVRRFRLHRVIPK